jgi:hypothetical protein
LKKHRSSSSGTSRSSSKGGFSFGKSSRSGGTGSSGKKPLFSGSGSKMKFGRKKPFVKPENDPGSKVRDGSGEFPQEYPAGEQQTGVVQQALQGTGCGCCSSIAGIVSFMVLGVIAVVIILALKCGGC